MFVRSFVRWRDWREEGPRRPQRICVSAHRIHSLYFFLPHYILIYCRISSRTLSSRLSLSFTLVGWCRPPPPLPAPNKRIDGEMNRLNHIHEYEYERNAKQERWSKVMEPKLPANFDFEEELLPVVGAAVAGFAGGVVDRSVSSSSSSSSPRRRKDERMAKDDPMRYCADRCVTTGHCDVFEVRM